MKVREAKDQVLELASKNLLAAGVQSLIDPDSPDGNDPGKFRIHGQTSRAIHRFDGWHVPINLSWFEGSIEEPQIHGFPFYWYAFAIPKYGGFDHKRYFICNYLQVRDWILDFDAPLGKDYRDQSNWRSDFQPYKHAEKSSLAYFRWGDEAIQDQSKLSRIVELDNILHLIDYRVRERGFEYRPESEAHLRLKEYIAANPQAIGLSAEFTPDIEHRYLTGDHVDIEFRSPDGRVVAVEIELEGEKELLVGVHQAIKYRSLSASHRRYSTSSDKVSAVLVAFQANYPEVISIAEQYGIDLVTVDPDDVL